MCKRSNTHLSASLSWSKVNIQFPNWSSLCRFSLALSPLVWAYTVPTFETFVPGYSLSMLYPFHAHHIMPSESTLLKKRRVLPPSPVPFYVECYTVFWYDACQEQALLGTMRSFHYFCQLLLLPNIPMLINTNKESTCRRIRSFSSHCWCLWVIMHALSTSRTCDPSDVVSTW